MTMLIGAAGRATQANLLTVTGGERVSSSFFGTIAKIGKAVVGAVVPGAGSAFDVIDTIRGGGKSARDFTGGSFCVPPFFDDGRGGCVLDIIPGPGGPDRPGQPGRDAAGAAVVGQFGVGMEPNIVQRAIRVCLRGMQLGSDGLCYNRGVLKNDQREWPRGRRPLLTGGDMAAISKASRAASRLERTTKRLQKIGLVKKPAAHRRAPQRRIGPGTPGTSIINVE